jgi:aminomethyltransferase
MTGYEALRSEAAWIDLSARGKIRATGEDRARLLHAMSTNNVRDLAPMQANYAFFLNAVGRMLADAYLYNLGESIVLDTEPETRGKLLEHLEKFIIADDVTLEDDTEKWACIGLEGPESCDVATSVGIPVPKAKLAIEEWENGFVARVGSTRPDGARVFVPIGQKHGFIEKLAQAGIPEADPEAARVVRLENGIPRYGEEISERYLVQETRQMHAVDFQKGCYLGQEIVERVRSRGQVHRLLMPVRITGEAIPAAGTKLTADGQPAGEISSAVYSPGLREIVALAYLRTEAVHNRPEMRVDAGDSKAYIREI